MKKLWLLAVLALAIGAAAIGTSVASANGVARYQFESATLTVSLEPTYPGNIHIYNIALNPCDGSFTGASTTGSVLGGIETITGTLGANTLAFVATYTSIIPGYHYDYSGLLAGGTAFDFHANGTPYTPSFTIANTLTDVVNTSNYKNHGDYVSSQGGGADAAHSCIGMPIH